MRDTREAMHNKWDRFIDEYSVDLNARRAYLTVYPTCSEKSADSKASLLLKKDYVIEGVRKKAVEYGMNVSLSKDDVLNDLIDIKNMYKTDKKQTDKSLKAIEIINKMLGYNTPNELSVLSVNEFNINNIVKFSV